MKKTLAAGLLGLITLASPLLAEETLTAAETAAITTTVNQLMTDLIRNGEALNADKMFAPLSDEPGAIFFTNGRFERVTAPAGTDYTTQEWYAKADPAGTPTWSAPYRDATGAFVVTCSLRVLEAGTGKPLGVVTADLAL
jgi:hypothetical protein